VPSDAAIVSVPVRVPAAAGRKVTLTAQVPPAAMLVPQLFVWAKSPVTAIDVIAAEVPALLLTSTLCGGLVVPVVWAPNARAVGLAVTPTGGGKFGFGHGPQKVVCQPELPPPSMIVKGTPQL
jgi:hypothetical protein